MLLCLMSGAYLAYPPPSRPSRWVPWVYPTIQTWSGYPPPQEWDTSLPSRPGQGTPCPRNGVPPHHPDLAGVPPSTPGMGYPPPSRPVWGTPPPQTWDGVPLHPRPGKGYPPTIQTWPGYPPAPTNVNRQIPVKTVASCRTTYAGGKNPPLLKKWRLRLHT